MKTILWTARAAALLVLAGTVIGLLPLFSGPVLDGRTVVAVALIVVGGLVWAVAIHARAAVLATRDRAPLGDW